MARRQNQSGSYNKKKLMPTWQPNPAGTEQAQSEHQKCENLNVAMPAKPSAVTEHRQRYRRAKRNPIQTAAWANNCGNKRQYARQQGKRQYANQNRQRDALDRAGDRHHGAQHIEPGTVHRLDTLSVILEPQFGLGPNTKPEYRRHGKTLAAIV
jgi:hypothetical protein